MRSSRPSRVARGAVVASVATFTALLSHVVAGGDVPGWVGIAAPWILALTVSTLLAGRALSPLRLGMSVVASQLLFHALFVMGSPSAPGSASTAPAHHHHATATTIPTPAASSVTTALCADPAMWFGHAIAAALTIAFLFHAERTARGLLALGIRIHAWVHRIITRGVAPVFPARAAANTPDAPGWIVRPAAHLSAHRRRGPPLSIAF